MSSDEDCYIISSQPSSSDPNKNNSICSIPKFTCPMCSESFKELSDIEAHIENEHLVT